MATTNNSKRSTRIPRILQLQSEIHKGLFDQDAAANASHTKRGTMAVERCTRRSLSSTQESMHRTTDNGYL
jgi:hypothetical protein